MSSVINRQQFLTADVKGKHLPKRPPWSVVESEFTTLCSRCGDCWRQCPENILKKGRGGYPIVDFNQRECTFCHQCADVCNSNAILLKKKITKGIAEDSTKNVSNNGTSKLDPWLVELSIDNNCVTQQGIVCGTCVEQCETEAITLIHQIAKVPQVKIDTSLCNGCGACESTCPTQSINVNRKAYYTSTNLTQGCE